MRVGEKTKIHGLADTSSDPHCLYCGEPLRRLWWMAMRCEEGRSRPYVPEVGGMHNLSMNGMSGTNYEKRILAFKPRRGSKHSDEQFARYEVFTGNFDNYGTAEEPFCKKRCAVDFAIAAARAGYRIKKKG